MKVEIPTSHSQPADAFTSGWEVTSISAITDARLVPAANGETNLEYTYKSGRQPYIQIAKNLNLYSVPDTFKITINTGNTRCSKITMSMSGALMSTSQIMEWPTVNPGEDFTYTVAMNDFLDDKEDLGNYPVQFQYLKFFLDASSQTSGEKYQIRIKNFDLVYDHITLSVDDITTAAALRVYPNPARAGQSEVFLHIDTPTEVLVRVYDLNGKLLTVHNYGHCDSGTLALPTAGLQPGNYLLQIVRDQQVDTAKLIVK